MVGWFSQSVGLRRDEERVPCELERSDGCLQARQLQELPCDRDAVAPGDADQGQGPHEDFEVLKDELSNLHLASLPADGPLSGRERPLVIDTR